MNKIKAKEKNNLDLILEASHIKKGYRNYYTLFLISTRE